MNKLLIKSILVFLLISCGNNASFENFYNLGERRVFKKRINLVNHPNIYISKNSKDDFLDSAQQLQEILSEITQVHFKIEQRDFTKSADDPGIYLGYINPNKHFELTTSLVEHKNFKDREAFILESNTAKKQLLVLSHHKKGVKRAVYKILFDLGYRLYSPADYWEYIPSSDSLWVSYKESFSPSFLGRTSFEGYSTWPELESSLGKYKEVNQFTENYLALRHFQWKIKQEYAEELEENPSYFVEVNNEYQVGGNLNPSEARVHEIFEEFALDWLEKNPNDEAFSVEPDDGNGGICNSIPCLDIGEYASDHVVHIANTLARKISSIDFNGRKKFVGFYAYNQHSHPPALKAEENVITYLANGFIRAKDMKFEEAYKLWSEKVKELGMYEYSAVYQWYKGVDERSRIADLDTMLKTIKFVHDNNGKYYKSEGADNYTPYAFNYFMIKRSLWDIKEIKNKDKYYEEFLEQMFEDAKEEMREFFLYLDHKHPLKFSLEKVRKQFSVLRAALTHELSEQSRKRIEHLVIYTQSLRLLYEYQKDLNLDTRQEKFKKYIMFTYRFRKLHLNHSHAAYVLLDANDGLVKIPDGATRNVRESLNPWKSSEPYTQEEILGFLGAEDDLILPDHLNLSSPVVYLDELSTASFKGNYYDLFNRGHYFQGDKSYLIYLKKGQELQFKYLFGYIKHYRELGFSPRISISKLNDRKELIADYRDLKKDGLFYEFDESISEEGLYLIDVFSLGGGVLEFKNDLNVSEVSEDLVIKLEKEDVKLSLDAFGDHGAYRYFYVPAGVSEFTFYSGSGRGKILNPSGQVVLDLQENSDVSQKDSYHKIFVDPEEAGEVWRVQKAQKPFRIYGVNPFLATHPNRLIIQSDVR